MAGIISDSDYVRLLAAKNEAWAKYNETGSSDDLSAAVELDREHEAAMLERAQANASRKLYPDESNREGIQLMLQHAYEFAISSGFMLPDGTLVDEGARQGAGVMGKGS